MMLETVKHERQPGAPAMPSRRPHDSRRGVRTSGRRQGRASVAAKGGLKFQRFFQNFARLSHIQRNSRFVQLTCMFAKIYKKHTPTLQQNATAEATP